MFQKELCRYVVNGLRAAGSPVQFWGKVSVAEPRARADKAANKNAE